MCLTLVFQPSPLVFAPQLPSSSSLTISPKDSPASHNRDKHDSPTPPLRPPPSPPFPPPHKTPLMWDWHFSEQHFGGFDIAWQLRQPLLLVASSRWWADGWLVGWLWWASDENGWTVDAVPLAHFHPAVQKLKPRENGISPTPHSPPISPTPPTPPQGSGGVPSGWWALRSSAGFCSAKPTFGSEANLLTVICSLAKLPAPSGWSRGEEGEEKEERKRRKKSIDSQSSQFDGKVAPAEWLSCRCAYHLWPPAVKTEL